MQTSETLLTFNLQWPKQKEISKRVEKNTKTTIDIKRCWLVFINFVCNQIKEHAIPTPRWSQAEDYSDSFEKGTLLQPIGHR